MEKRLITSALPYVNNIPHLGNLIQVLSADVFARYCRLRGYETLYICGTDEYGTATETRALEEGITPRELCTRYYEIHKDIYEWFSISFDRFGRTSTDAQTKIVQEIFLDLHKNGYIREREIEQLYSEASDMFLADRYVRGTCPHCGYGEARGDQCENCGKLLDPSELIEPRSAVDDSRPVLRKTKHLYIDLPAIRPKLEEWMDRARVEGRWAKNAVQMTQAWIRDGLKERGITRDLKWGIPVPLEGYESKVFYVWFDAPIGYISITANHTDDWESWWRDPEHVRLFQFIGKDNIPFHTVVFPSSLLGSGKRWTMLHHMSSTEYMNYEAGKFSKSKGVGVFGNDAKETGIPADVWRFYIFYNRPETSDFTFTWSDFQAKTNGELIGNFSNLVNRTLTFISKYFDGNVLDVTTAGEDDLPQDFDAVVSDHAGRVAESLEWAGIREAFHTFFELSDYGNRVFQTAEPWKARHDRPEAAHRTLSRLVYLVRDLAVLAEPFIPSAARRILSMLGTDSPSWELVGNRRGIESVERPEILFSQLESDQIEAFRARFSGTQAQRAEAAAAEAANEEATGKSVAGRVEATGAAPGTDGPPGAANGAQEKQTPPSAEEFAQTIDLRAARITSVERHPKADKLYIETLDDGTDEGRTIVSGLVPHYSAEELEGKTIVVVANLKPAKLRGVMSQGMLLAADRPTTDGGEEVEVLFLQGVEPGTRIGLEGVPAPPADQLPDKIDIDKFFSFPIRVENHEVVYGKARLAADGKPIRTTSVSAGKVG